MLRRVEVLRFKAGQRTAAPPPEVFWERAPEGVPTEAGEELVILVDLEPYIPHRAREVRTLAEETYWTALGSVTARMRRALAAANRYLVQHNVGVTAEQRTYGSLSLMSFWQDEAFIGQVGPGNTLIHYPQQRLLELFPKAGRAQTPLGVAVPPVIHISYATLEPGCQVVLLTNSIMQTRYIPAWEALLADQATAPDADIFAAELARKQVSGGAIHVFCLTDEEVQPAPPARRKLYLLPWSRAGRSAPDTVSPAPATPTAGTGAAQPGAWMRLWARWRTAIMSTSVGKPSAMAQPVAGAEQSGAVPAPEAPRSAGDAGKSSGVAEPGALARLWSRWRAGSSAADTGEASATPVLEAWAYWQPAPGAEAQKVKPEEASRPDLPQAGPGPLSYGEEEAALESSADLEVSDEETEEKTGGWWSGLRARLRLQRISEEGAEGQSQRCARRFTVRGKVWHGKRRKTTRRMTLFIQKTLQPLLPGRAAPSSTPLLRPVPAEMRWFPWLALALALLALLVTGLAYADMGGAQRAASLLEEAEKARTLAYEQQTPESWRKVQSLANTVLVLDANNEQARALRDEAALALDALQKAALLALQPLRELGVSPQPRRIIATDAALYLLNPLTDEVLALDAREPGVARSLLKRGQVLNGHTIPHLVDIAWMEPAPGFLDGALLVYGDGGYLYTYEPTLGPESITVQLLAGDLPPGAVTMMGLWGTRLYVVQRQANALLRYQPLNGLYNAPPRPYFAPTLTPPLQNVLALALDGRVYLLSGDGTLQAYYEGVEDPGFKVQGLPDPIQPTILALDPEPDGEIYLADPRQELIVVLDRKGTFRHQFRLPGHMGRSLEALAVSPDGKTLYLVAENKLYQAPLPDFAQ